MTQSITAGTKSQLALSRHQKTQNRLVSELLSRKNQLSTISILRQIVAVNTDSSKQSERANEMRRVHASYPGSICEIHSSEGESAGTTKQLACTATICKASSSILLKQILNDDHELIPLAKLKPVDLIDLQNVKVNGDWIGAVRDSMSFVKKYRTLRRIGKINPMTTIVHEITQDAVFFWTDVGRIVRPLIIVYNTVRDADFLRSRGYKFDNIANAKSISSGEPATDAKSTRMKGYPFQQGVLLTRDMIDGLQKETITINDLLRDQVIEYITADELDNCYLCSSFGKLVTEQNDELHEYTHLEIPEAQIGFTAMITPYSNHNQTLRTTFESMQARQACGYFAMNWPFRSDKHTFLQYNNESPALHTAVNRYLFPNGTNVMIAVMINSGYGQEDSIIINKSAFECGLFDGCAFKYEKAELEQKEEFGIPNFATTQDIKSANYEKLDKNGFIQVGMTVEKGDAIIGKYMRLTHAMGSDSPYTHVDCSIIYKDDESALVHNVIVGKNEDNERFVKVVLRKPRPVITGDKFCAALSAELLTDIGWVQLKDIDIHTHRVATLTNNGSDLAYIHPSNKYEYDHDGDMYELKSQQVEIFCTPNHRLYVQRRDDKNPHRPYEFIEAQNVMGTRVRFKKDAVNVYPNQEYFTIESASGQQKRYPMAGWLKLLGMFISDGCTSERNGGSRSISIAAKKERKKAFHRQFLTELNVDYTMSAMETRISGSRYPEIYEELKKSSLGALNKYLPDYVWQLSQRDARVLLNALVEGDGSHNLQGSACYYTSSKRLANDVARLALHAGWSGTVKLLRCEGDPYRIYTAANRDETISEGKLNADTLSVRIVKTKNHPMLNHGHCRDQNGQSERMVHYTGRVGCIEMPETHLFYYRENMFAPPVWISNSSRHGRSGHR
jgi:hypothetical protein